MGLFGLGVPELALVAGAAALLFGVWPFLQDLLRIPTGMLMADANFHAGEHAACFASEHQEASAHRKGHL